CHLIALRCTKNHRPFNSVLDEDYQAEVEMLQPGTIIPSPQMVSHDIKAMYTEMSKHVKIILWSVIYIFVWYYCCSTIFGGSQ
ncbi:hypothetical protein L208DRAFT_1351366, partial [Tricholoma matsutake]